MTDKSPSYSCPHCASSLYSVVLPEGTGWETGAQWVCFNDECSYFQEGWDWMWENYRAKASYRYRIINPQTGSASPLPVWSTDALRNFIVEQ